jgi:hypothetical protein
MRSTGITITMETDDARCDPTTTTNIHLDQSETMDAVKYDASGFDSRHGSIFNQSILLTKIKNNVGKKRCYRNYVPAATNAGCNVGQNQNGINEINQ